MQRPGLDTPIVWFYYDGIEKAAQFYGETLGFELVLDEGWAKIFEIAAGSFVGVVDGSSGKGHCQQAEDSAVLLTLVVDDVDRWRTYLEGAGVKIEGETRDIPVIDVRCFFFKDPGGYAIEIQKFTNPKTAQRFRLPSGNM